MRKLTKKQIDIQDFVDNQILSIYKNTKFEVKKRDNKPFKKSPWAENSPGYFLIKFKT